VVDARVQLGELLRGAGSSTWARTRETSDTVT
jgi:hypothetical protein